MSLISIHNLSIAFGGPPLLDDISLEIHKGQRISFLGRNGAGKTTFMKILAGIVHQDSGEIITEPGVTVAYLPQDVPAEGSGTIYETVAKGLGEPGGWFAELFRTEKNDAPPSVTNALHEKILHADCWHLQPRIDRILSTTQLDGNREFATLSGGLRRRVYLARALVREPDLLLLDEPTNHLDIPSITWLESFILSSKLTVLFVTHDRRLLTRLATRILELDRGRLVDWSCNYRTFLIRKQEVLDAEEKAWERFDKKLVQEEVWIRRGIKARRTRNEGRVRALEKMRVERMQRRERSGTVQLEISEAARSGTRVIEMKKCSFSYDTVPVVKSFSTTIMRGDRIGIIGPNGCGKSTLLKLLFGTLSPRKGTIRRGTNIQSVFFDQFREILDSKKTVWENVAPGGGDTVFVNGVPKHVLSYLQNFLFTTDRAKSPVKQLSGGERNRLLLARIFAVQSNILILDEPTNDLDTETLELLEDLLSNYSGTVLIVSHDREFLNNTVTSVFAFEGDGVVKEYVGGYDDWERQTTNNQPATKPLPEKKAPVRSKKNTPTKRSYRQQQEFEKLPGQIEEWEAHLHSLAEAMADPDRYTQEGFIKETKSKCEELEKIIAEAYKRWEELEAMGG